MQYLHSRKRYFPSLYPLDLMHRAYFRSSEYYPGSFTKIVSVNKNGQLKFLHTLKDINRLQKLLTHELFKNPKLIDTANNKICKIGKKLDRIYFNLERVSLDKISDLSLIDLFDQLNNLHEEVLKYSWLPIPVLPEHLSFLLRDSLSKKVDPSKIEEIFQNLTSPTQASLIEIQEQELLVLAGWVQKKLKKRLLRQNVKELPLNIYQKVVSYARKYAWVPVNYHGEPWKPNDIWKKAREILNKNNNPLMSLTQRKKHFSSLKRNQKLITKKLDLTDKEKIWSQVLRDVAIIQDERKALVTEAHYYTNLILKEIGLRINIHLTDLWWLTTKEIKKSFQQKKIDFSLIKQRKQLWVLITTKNKEKVFVGKKAELIYKEIVTDEEISSDKIQGSCASRGKAVGEVRKIITPDESGKMQKGEILVTMMTTPDFLLAMSKAAAIVTDEGGITSHAAIVSRELGIPCIVGTGNATEVLEDGQLVEVDADKGVVKKIKK